MRFLFALAFACISSCPLSVNAADHESAITLSFKPAAQATETSVRVSDVVLVRSSDASAAIAAGRGEIVLQPAPGSSAAINRQDVVAAIGKVDSALLARLKWSGNDQLSVDKPGSWLDAETATTRAQEALQQWLGSHVKSYELQSRGRIENKWIEAGADIRYIIPSTAKVRRLMPVQVEITDVSGKSRSFPIWFATSVMQEAWVLTRDFAAGEMISSSDLVLQVLDTAALDSESIPASSNPDGLMIALPTKAGAVLLESSVKLRPDVLVGEVVSVKLNWPMVQLETTGLALQSAERGGRVLIRNERSGETLVARVTDRDVVEVGP